MNVEAHNNLGNLYLGKGLFDEAAREFQRVIAIDPRYATAHINLSAAYLSLGRSDAAAAEARAALQIDPRSPDAMVNLSLAQSAAGQPGDAQGSLRRALEIDPHNAAAHYNLARQFEAAGEAAAAIDHYKQFLQYASPEQTAYAADVRARLPALDRAHQVGPWTKFRRAAPGRSPLSALRRLAPRRHRQRSRRLRARGRRSRGVLGRRSRASSSGSTPWTRVLEWKPPHAKWFVGGKLNASVNCLDRHVRGPRRNKAAFIWEGEPGDRRTLTYWDLYRQVNAFANVLKSLGVKRGDRVALYLPLIPELAIAMLACARIGAVHSVVFGGFSAESLRDRINDSQCVLLVTADGGYRRGNIVPLKQMADEALREHAVDQERRRRPAPGRRADSGAHAGGARPLVSPPDAGRARCDCEPEAMDSEDMLYILYTSGHHREAEGHRPHDRRLSHRHLRDDEVGLRSEGGRRLLVHRRHRLGHRAQLRRLRAARQRRDGRDVRRGARLAAEGSLLGDHRAPRRDDLLHRADGDSRVHAVGHRVAGEARPRARCGCSDRSASRSTRKRGSGIT